MCVAETEAAGGYRAVRQTTPGRPIPARVEETVRGPHQAEASDASVPVRPVVSEPRGSTQAAAA